MATEALPTSVDNKPLKSPLRYPGGKSRVAKLLLQHEPPHREYREPFAGGAALFFHKAKAEKNWLNDKHPGLYALYVTLRDDFDAFAEICRQQRGDRRSLFDYWTSRRDLMDAEDEEALLERAVQFYFINRTVWGGRVVYDLSRKSRLYFSNPQGWNHLEKKLAHLKQISEKLQGVKITCLSFEECLEDATEETFIYCDPPYIRDTNCHPTNKLYDKSFQDEHHERLARLLHDTTAKVMLSYDDCPQARALYNRAHWHFAELEWKYCGRYAVTKEAKANGIRERKVTGQELLILNYEPLIETRKRVLVDTSQVEEIREAVTRAFLATHEGRSMDDVVICDRLNKKFIEAASSTVGDVEPRDLNWHLLNLRKSAKLGPVTTVRRTLRNQEEYVHAAEIAARFMEDLYNVTVDRLLCNPGMRQHFDKLAGSIAPGHSNYEYRKAALNLRKRGRLKPELVNRIMRSGRRTKMVHAIDVLADASRIPELPGLYIFEDESGCLYTGESRNLRSRVSKHLDHSDRKSLAHYFWRNDIRKIRVELIAFDKESLGADRSNRKALEASLIQSRSPRFNIQHRT